MHNLLHKVLPTWSGDPVDFKRTLASETSTIRGGGVRLLNTFAETVRLARATPLGEALEDLRPAVDVFQGARPLAAPRVKRKSTPVAASARSQQRLLHGVAEALGCAQSGEAHGDGPASAQHEQSRIGSKAKTVEVDEVARADTGDVPRIRLRCKTDPKVLASEASRKRGAAVSPSVRKHTRTRSETAGPDGAASSAPKRRRDGDGSASSQHAVHSGVIFPLSADAPQVSGRPLTRPLVAATSLPKVERAESARIKAEVEAAAALAAEEARIEAEEVERAAAASEAAPRTLR